MIDEDYIQPYYAKVIKEIEIKPGCWSYTEIGVFDKMHNLLGTYQRNYPSFYKTFYPFERNGKWYALYSPNYTCTRLMSLPDCKDLGGEEPHGLGFCPVEFFVPMISCHEGDPTEPCPGVANHDTNKWAKVVKEKGYDRLYWPDDPKGHTHLKEEYLAEHKRSHAAFEDWLKRHPFSERHAPFGFVAGCIWGDDSSWKVEYLDLSQVEKGIIKRDARFGYAELPVGVNLCDAVGEIYDYDNDKGIPDDTKHTYDIPLAVNATFVMGPDGKVRIHGLEKLPKNE